MKHIITSTIFPILLLASMIAGCSANGDDIGELYGTWKLESLTSDAGTVTFDTIFMAFQGEAYSYNVNWSVDWGVYQLSDNTLTLNPLQSGKTFKAMHLDITAPTFTINHLGSSSMTLQRSDSIWTFKKHY